MLAETTTDVDQRRVFLLRAAIRHELFERGELDSKQAVDDLKADFLHIVFPLPALGEWAESLWSNPGWAEAAREYHEARGDRPTLSRLVRKVRNGWATFDPDIRFYRRLLDDDISFDRAYRAIQERKAAGT
jgi:hypothetical protein